MLRDSARRGSGFSDFPDFQRDDHLLDVPRYLLENFS
jgi:hypothetical protein